MQGGRGWSISKVINVGDVITILVFSFSIFMMFNSVDKRIASNTQSIQELKERRAEDMDRIDKRLESIDKKLDRIIESNR